jgi:CubicO group peptidase (beta-lactamase class C family)
MKNALLIMFIVLIIFQGCHQEDGSTEYYTYTVPENLDDGLDVGYLANANIDYELIESLMNQILNGSFSMVQSVLIYRYGKLVLEEYFSGWNRDMRHYLASCTKSMTSVIFGIARDRGLIKELDQRLFSRLPDYIHLASEMKNRITLRHVLTFTAGFEWDQNPLDNNNNLSQMVSSPDMIEYILDRPMEAEPGTVWNYNGGCTQLLAEIVERTSGESADEFIRSNLFEPLGITDFDWYTHQSGKVIADYGLEMRPRDMLKVGLLFLNRGLWKGKRIVSEKWVNDSTTRHIILSDTHGYGFQWWSQDYPHQQGRVFSFYASGNGGQRIMVFPSLDMVVVFTEGAYNHSTSSDAMITGYILPAVQMQ